MGCDTLDQLDWEYDAGQYTLHLTQGKAIIIEDKSSGSLFYQPHIQGMDEQDLVDFPHEIDDFETAEMFVRASLITLDQQGVDEPAFAQKLASTLDTCAALLPEPHRLYHRARLENIKRWFFGQSLYSDMVKPPTNDWADHEFDWQQIDNRYVSDVPPHGKAVIVETPSDRSSAFSFGTTSHYNLQVEDETGVILKDYVPPTDFLSAEERMRTILSELEQPFIGEVYVDHISFTIKICQCLLPQDADLMQYVRLDYIDGYLGEVLP